MRSVCVRYAFEIRSGCLSSCLPPCMRVGRTVLYCTTCKYGSPHSRTGCVRDMFAMHSVGVRFAFGMRSVCVRDACLPACLPVCMQAVGTRTSTDFIPRVPYSYISRTRGRSYGTVGAAMRPRCGDPPYKVCTAVGKLDIYCTPLITLLETLRLAHRTGNGSKWVTKFM